MYYKAARKHLLHGYRSCSSVRSPFSVWKTRLNRFSETDSMNIPSNCLPAVQTSLHGNTRYAKSIALNANIRNNNFYSCSILLPSFLRTEREREREGERREERKQTAFSGCPASVFKRKDIHQGDVYKLAFLNSRARRNAKILIPFHWMADIKKLHLNHSTYTHAQTRVRMLCRCYRATNPIAYCIYDLSMRCTRKFCCLMYRQQNSFDRTSHYLISRRITSALSNKRE
jgi:hypothetical protein